MAKPKKNHKLKHPPMEIFDDEAICKAAEKFLWEARRLVATDARQIRNLVSFSKFFFEYMPAKTLDRMENQIKTWTDSGLASTDQPSDE